MLFCDSYFSVVATNVIWTQWRVFVIAVIDIVLSSWSTGRRSSSNCGNALAKELK